jgi:hypothetical protein
MAMGTKTFARRMAPLWEQAEQDYQIINFLYSILSG